MAGPGVAIRGCATPACARSGWGGRCGHVPPCPQWWRRYPSERRGTLPGRLPMQRASISSRGRNQPTALLRSIGRVRGQWRGPGGKKDSRTGGGDWSRHRPQRVDTDQGAAACRKLERFHREWKPPSTKRSMPAQPRHAAACVLLRTTIDCGFTCQAGPPLPRRTLPSDRRQAARLRSTTRHRRTGVKAHARTTDRHHHERRHRAHGGEPASRSQHPGDPQRRRGETA